MIFITTDIQKYYGDVLVLDQVSFAVEAGEFIALLGPSGSGKTTLLNIIAGLQQPDGGHLVINGADITNLPAGKRRFGMVFQDYALFKHMNVEDNIGFGLKIAPRKNRLGRQEIKQQVQKLLAMIEMESFADRFPAQLSGGQKQRVALARALAINPQLLLLDEPFSALDAKVRQSLRRSVRTLQRSLNVAAILVTHDQTEAWELADRVAIINKGKIEQFDTPQRIRESPASDFVKDFLHVETDYNI